MTTQRSIEGFRDLHGQHSPSRFEFGGVNSLRQLRIARIRAALLTSPEIYEAQEAEARELVSSLEVDASRLEQLDPEALINSVNAMIGNVAVKPAFL